MRYGIVFDAEELSPIKDLIIEKMQRAGYPVNDKLQILSKGKVSELDEATMYLDFYY